VAHSQPTDRAVIDVLTMIVTLILPPPLKPWLLSLLGHKVHRTAAIGFVLIWGTRLYLGKGARIGSANLIACRRIVMREKSVIGWGNILKGPFKVRCGYIARIGNRNIIQCGQRMGPGRPSSVLWLAEDARITGQHSLDLTRSIKFGRHSHLAGRQSQIWTHGYVHARRGYDRARIDGGVFLGNNVYIGAFSCISPGVRVEDCIVVGSHSSIAQHLETPGVYVSQALRYIDMDPYQNRLDIERDVDDQLDPDVRLKRSGDGIGYR
jgi:acetyltransferase-like isoleucine patch superfamily enzyme